MWTNDTASYQQLGMRITRTVVKNKLFLAWSGYKIHVCDEPLHGKLKVNIGKTGLAFGLDAFIYVGISSARVVDLKKAVRSMASQKKQSEINYLVSLREEIHNFFKWNQRASL